jgi:dihydropyrimidinase
MRTLIRGGTVVSAAGPATADVLVDGETVAALLHPEQATGLAGAVDATVDATGRYVIPGGVDVHTHLDMPLGTLVSADDFETGTRAAAWGGTTSIIDFAVQRRGGSLAEALDAWHAKATGKACVDYGFHLIVAEVTERTLAELDALTSAGVTSFKLFMAYPGRLYSDDGGLLRAMQRAAGNGATIMMHAENGIAIDVLAAQALAAGQASPRWHGRTRPAELEGEATARAIALAGVAGAPLYIVHLSAQQALAAVAGARAAGRNVFAETCPQYLYLSEDDLEAAGPAGAGYVCSPPLRPAGHQPHLWRGLRTGDLSVVATDHCPFRLHPDKQVGRDDFTKIPNGLPVIEHRMDLLHEGVASGRLSLARWVEVTSTAPARMFGLYPRKGAILPGSDADIVIYDPAARQVLSARSHHMAADYSVFEGRPVRGRVATVLARGEVIVDGGRWLGRPGRGRFLPRGLCQYLR